MPSQFTTETDDTQDRQTTGHRNNTNNRLSLPPQATRILVTESETVEPDISYLDVRQRLEFRVKSFPQTVPSVFAHKKRPFFDAFPWCAGLYVKAPGNAGKNRIRFL